MRALILLGGVALLQLALWLAWGDPTPIYDEAGYLRAGTAVADALRCGTGWMHGPTCAEVGPADLGRLLWHNPGYAALFVLADLLPGSAAGWIRGLQLLAGLLAGFAVHRTLLGRVPDSHALAAAALVWLLPSQLFFRLTLWPVALGTCLVAAVLLGLRRLGERPSLARQHQLGLLVLGLVLVWPLALAALPLLGVGLLRLGLDRGEGMGPARRVLLPTALAWSGLLLVTSLALGQPTNGTLSSPENLALANNPFIASGRGSSLHDPDSVARVQFEAHQTCPQGNSLTALRCRGEVWREMARTTIGQAPGDALRRAGLRVLETWRRDEYMARHLADPRVTLRVRPPAALVDVEQVAELVVFALLLVCAALGGRDRRVLAMLAVVALCTAPVLFGVGLTRLRQPLLPAIATAAALTLARYSRRR